MKIDKADMYDRSIQTRRSKRKAINLVQPDEEELAMKGLEKLIKVLFEVSDDEAHESDVIKKKPTPIKTRKCKSKEQKELKSKLKKANKLPKPPEEEKKNYLPALPQPEVLEQPQNDHPPESIPNINPSDAINEPQFQMGENPVVQPIQRIEIPQPPIISQSSRERTTTKVNSLHCYIAHFIKSMSTCVIQFIIIGE